MLNNLRWKALLALPSDKIKLKFNSQDDNDVEEYLTIFTLNDPLENTLDTILNLLELQQSYYLNVA